LETLISMQMPAAVGHYAGGLMGGANVLKRFVGAVNEAFIRHEGDEGLMLNMSAEILATVRKDGLLEAKAKRISVGKLSCLFECTADKVIQLVHPEDSGAYLLAEPVLVVKAVAVVPASKQQWVAKQ